MRLTLINFFFILYISSSSVLTEETVTDKETSTSKIENEILTSSNSTSTTKIENEFLTSSLAPIIEVTTDKNTDEIVASSTTAFITESNSVEETNSNESSEDSSPQPTSSSSSSSATTTAQRRKVLYINQQQSGKLNVHLELNDVSLIVIPNNKDPQLSLLNLLLRSAQKSNLKRNNHRHNEESKKEEEKHDDDYTSKYKMDNYMQAASTIEPSIESRAPYRVDISSTLNQHPVTVDQSMARSPPIVKLLNPSPIIIQNSRQYKRSLDTHFLGHFNPDILNDSSISESSNNSSDEEQQELINSIEINQNNLTPVEKLEEGIDSDSEFILLGAVENPGCGPNRYYNSYQICVQGEEN